MRRGLLASLLIVHGLLHASTGVWAVAGNSLATVSTLWALAIVGYVAAGFAVLRLPILRTRWKPILVTATLASLILLFVYGGWLGKVGIIVDLVLAFVDTPEHAALQWAFLLGGTVLFAVGSGFYIGAGLGPGPRDSVMTAFAKRGYRVGVVRTVIEVTVLAIGWLLGGTVGIGTLLYALAIGPLVQVFMPWVDTRPLVEREQPASDRPEPVEPASGEGGGDRPAEPVAPPR